MTSVRQRGALDVAVFALAAGLAALVVAAAMGPRSLPLSRDPLDLEALRTLGLRLDRLGRSDEADQVLSFVGRRTWRDGPTQVWLMRRRLAQDRLEEAFESADSLLRRDAEETTRPALFALFVAAAEHDDARAALTTRLAAAPWWRADFLQTLGARADVAGARTVFAALAAGPTPPAPAEYGPFINRLVSERDYVEALSAWRQIARKAGTEGLRDGAFSGVSDHTPFTWSAAEGVGGASAAAPSPDGSAIRTLRVDYDGYASPLMPAQLLVPGPERYVVTWRERIDPPGSERLFWRVRCADSGQVLARAPAVDSGFAAPSVWRAKSMDVQPPSVGCAGQWLELATAAGERREAVTAWFADFQMRPGP